VTILSRGQRNAPPCDFDRVFRRRHLVAPVAANADDHEKRYYDRDGHDYHAWNDHEDRAYRIYLGEQHRDYREFGKVKVTQQREYFKWRHEHPDDALFKVEVK
jgi:hypothetical protein